MKARYIPQTFRVFYKDDCRTHGFIEANTVFEAVEFINENEDRNIIDDLDIEIVSSPLKITAIEYCNMLDRSIGEAWSNDYIDLAWHMEEYAKLKYRNMP